MDFQTQNYHFQSNSPYSIEMTVLEERCDYLKLKWKIDFGGKISPEPTVIRWEFPCKDVFSQWTPSLQLNHNLRPNWNPIRTGSRSASGLPVMAHLNLKGENRQTVALSDVRTPLEISAGIWEETAEFTCKLTLFVNRISAISEYETEMILDNRTLPYYDVLCDVQRYWESLGYPCATFPEEAISPMYSTWYSYHQNLDRDVLLEELKLAKEYGMKAVIVDDGWQNSDNNRGYASCGDWEAIRIPDMKGFVEDVHALGMKYIMWYSVPFVGIEAKAWKKFEGKFLDSFDPKHPWCRLDPRYPEVRDYLITIYENAVKEWKLDGLKLDFIDSFQLTEESANPKAGMDFESLEDGVCALLSEAKERLSQLNPDIMIEFRQSYVGPIMCTYGNMIRLADAPADPLMNRVGSMRLRLTCGSSPVHADMLMWHYEDSAEAAALELLNVLFCVPQISVRLAEIPESHRKMLKFYLDLWCENRDCLLNGHLVVKNPEANCSLVYTEKDGALVAVAYAKNTLKLEKEYSKILFLNGVWEEDLLLCNAAEAYDAVATVFDCMGNVVSKKELTVQNGYNAFAVPNSGVLQIEKK